MYKRFKGDNSFDKRCQLANRIKQQYSDRAPIIVETAKDSKLQLAKEKYLAPFDISVGAFLNEIRKHSSVRPEEAVFIFCGENSHVLVPTTNTIAEVYNKYKDDDGFLYITVALENTFGTFFTVSTIANGLLDQILKSSAKLSRTVGLNDLV